MRTVTRERVFTADPGSNEIYRASMKFSTDSGVEGRSFAQTDVSKENIQPCYGNVHEFYPLVKQLREPGASL